MVEHSPKILGSDERATTTTTTADIVLLDFISEISVH